MKHNHSALAQDISYSTFIFLIGLIIGIVLDIWIPWEFTTHTLRAIGAGWILLITAPVILFWGDQSRATCYHHDQPGHACKSLGAGPYAFTRHPKYVAFVLLIIGLGLILNAIPMLIIAFVLFLLFTFIVIPQEEKALMDHLSNYEEYHQKVPMWF
jgi:protein-S-isoprenylcysteine O-methyltransferase Ste14